MRFVARNIISHLYTAMTDNALESLVSNSYSKRTTFIFKLFEYIYIGAHSCVGAGDQGSGHNLHNTCTLNKNYFMWTCDEKTGKCFRLIYKGCGGNHNRYCSQAACMQACSDKFYNKNQRDEMLKSS